MTEKITLLSLLQNAGIEPPESIEVAYGEMYKATLEEPAYPFYRDFDVSEYEGYWWSTIFDALREKDDLDALEMDLKALAEKATEYTEEWLHDKAVEDAKD